MKKNLFFIFGLVLFGILFLGNNNNTVLAYACANGQGNNCHCNNAGLTTVTTYTNQPSGDTASQYNGQCINGKEIVYSTYGGSCAGGCWWHELCTNGTSCTPPPATCTYASAVNQWGSCIGGLSSAVPSSVVYTTTSNSASCVNVPVTRACNVAPCNTLSVQDADGNTYGLTNIGTQTWMTQNLKTTKYDSGVTIPEDNRYPITGGQLYTYWVTNMSTLCPSGWHVPKADDWTTLISNLGGVSSSQPTGLQYSIVGGKLKTISRGGTNDYGFSAVGGGKVDSDYGWSYAVPNVSYWWVADSVYPVGGNSVVSMNDDPSSANLFWQYPRSRDAKMSVRCIKNTACPENLTLSAAASNTCGGNIDFTWNKVDGATGYNLYKNNLPSFWGSATNDIFSLTLNKYLPGNGTNAWPATSTDVFTIKSYVYSGGVYIYSTASNPVSATPSAPCGPLAASCSATSNNGFTATSTVKWTANPTGGVTPYRYSWIFSDNSIAGNVSSSTKIYSVPGNYFATTTVSDGVSTTTVGCRGAVTGVGSCTNDCGVVIKTPAPLSGICSANSSSITVGSSTTWTAYPSGGTAPYTYLWSNGVSGSINPTSVTYNATGTKYASVSITDHAGSSTGAIICSSLLVTDAPPIEDQTLVSCNNMNTNPSGGLVNVNNNITFTATGVPTICSSCRKEWTIRDSNNQNPTAFVSNPNPLVLDKIFTTTGLKEVTFTVSTTTNNITRVGACVSTKTVVQEGGSSRER